MSTVISSLAQAEEASHSLPMPPIAYFLVAFGLFLLLLAATWAFRNNAYKYQQNRTAAPGHDEHGHSAIEQGTHH